MNLMEELGIECLVGHPAEIRAPNHESRNMIGEMRIYFYHFQSSELPFFELIIRWA